MALRLMYITNDPVVARIAEDAGVDIIFLDMEYIGKSARQGGMDTVQLHHTVEDIRRIRDTLRTAELLVRVNPIHEAGEENGIPYGNSEEEIEGALRAGADILMLPYFRTTEEVRMFTDLVRGRAVTFPLLETPEAADSLDDILAVPGIDRIHIGLNDLSLARRSGFMFGLLADGTVEHIAEKCRAKRIPFGFGGIAGPGEGMLPAEYIIAEHYRLGSSFVILSRSFCDTSCVTDYAETERIFRDGIGRIRRLEAFLQERLDGSDTAFFEENRLEVIRRVEAVRELCRKRQGEAAAP